MDDINQLYDKLEKTQSALQEITFSRDQYRKQWERGQEELKTNTAMLAKQHDRNMELETENLRLNAELATMRERAEKAEAEMIWLNAERRRDALAAQPTKS
jgi:predicted  nucleic acid-binding Zn-ribbon protein